MLTDAEPGYDVTSERVGEIAGDISCQNLTFRYGEFLPNVLDGLTLRIEAGEHVAINGRSGSGKSTLVKLLTGLLQPTSGKIRIGGHVLHGPALRKYVGCVSQNETILPGRMDECIGGTRLRIDIERVMECAKLAAIHDDILAMPMGYATAIGDMGDTLSGGQKLRLAWRVRCIGSRSSCCWTKRRRILTRRPKPGSPGLPAAPARKSGLRLR